MSERYLKGCTSMARHDNKYECALVWNEGKDELRIFDLEEMEAVKNFLFANDQPTETRFRALGLSGPTLKT